MISKLKKQHFQNLAEPGKAPRQDAIVAQIQVAKKSHFIPIVDSEDEEEDEYIWEPQGKFIDICESLIVFHDKKDPDGEKMTKRQMKESYNNFLDWLDDVIDRAEKTFSDEQDNLFL